MSGPQKRPGGLWQRAALGSEASAGYDLAANVIVGLGLGYLAQRYLGVAKPWGFVAGVLLGSASGFYQLFKRQSAPKKPKAD